MELGKELQARPVTGAEIHPARPAPNSLRTKLGRLANNRLAIGLSAIALAAGAFEVANGGGSDINEGIASAQGLENTPAQISNKLPDRPNVLLVISDDQRDHTMKYMQRKTVPFFGAGGVTYPNGYATSGLCCPTRTSIFTGQNVQNHHVTNNDTPGVANFQHQDSLEYDLSNAGYYTGIFGKFLNGWKGQVPYYDVTGLTDQRVTKNSDKIVANLARHFIQGREKNDDQPWFATVAFHSPHGPWPKQNINHKLKNIPSRHEHDLSDKPPYVRARGAEIKGLVKHGKRTSNRDSQNGQIHELQLLDKSIGALTHKLRSKGELRNTIAFYISDQGYFYGEHGLSGKHLPYREDLEVPFFMRWPGRVAKGSVDNRISTNNDIAPTIYDALDLTPGNVVDGKSLLDPSWSRDYAFSEMGTTGVNDAWAAFTNRNQQYIETLSSLSPSARVTWTENYNLATDPYELRGLANGVSPELAERIHQALGCKGSSCP